ncbi:MAG: leucine-rich repeat domain-containing protein [Candidatus Levyibacteriota bacterium]
MDKLTTIVLKLSRKTQLVLFFCVVLLIGYFLSKALVVNYASNNNQTEQVAQKYSCPFNYKMYRLTQLPQDKNNVCGLEIDAGDNLKGIAPVSESLVHVDQLLIQDQDDANIPPEIGNLKSLTTVIIADNDGDMEVPPEIGDLNNLSHLTISKNEGLESLPISVAKLTNLQTLLIRYNPKLKVPDSLVTLAKLTSLTVVGENIKSLSPRVYLLSQLQILNYSLNQIATVSSDIGNMYSLQQINFLGNNLYAFPAVDKLQNLQLIDLSYNHLTKLPSGVTKLKKVTSLHASDNQLTDQAVADISRLTKLISLDLGDNKLTKVPSGIENIKSLQYIRLAGNNINATEIAKLKQKLPHTTVDF